MTARPGSSVDPVSTGVCRQPTRRAQAIAARTIGFGRESIGFDNRVAQTVPARIFALVTISIFQRQRGSPLSPLVIPTRISYFALLATAMCAAPRNESRMQIIKATDLDRKSG